MTNKLKTIAIIMARGGSKGLVGKNLKLLNGKPLIAYSIEDAIKSGVCDTVLVTSDDEDIIKDIGPKTSRKNEKLFQEAGTILWNGPVGVFEKKPFENGTKDIASAICKSNAFTIAGGGDTISALEKFANISSINYVSTGGGAFLQFLEGKELPGIEIIKKL